jgi:hypothetical protein
MSRCVYGPEHYHAADLGEHRQHGELIPTALAFFAVAAGLGWIGNRFWPEDWRYKPLL